MKHPGHLYTIVLNFGPNIPAFQQHHADRAKAIRTMDILKGRARKAGCIDSIELWHNHQLISSYTPNPETTVWLPPPGPDGVRRIPEGVSSVNATCLANWERYGKPADMLGKVPKAARKPKSLPSQIPYNSDVPVI